MNEKDRAKTARLINTATHIYDRLGVHWQGDYKEARRKKMMFVHPDHYPQGASAAAALNTACGIMADIKAHQKYRLITFAKKAHCPSCRNKGFIVRQKGFHTREEIVCSICLGSGFAP